MKNQPDTIYTVSRLNQTARLLLENHFSNIWLEGEISNLARPSSGHLYFSVKDDNSQCRCAMFRRASQGLNILPENGMHVLLHGKISLYEGRGDYQMIVEHMEEVGDGRLQRLFAELKQQLAQQGLFDAQHKQPLPKHITTIGIITSPTGAAIHDILTTLKRRYPLADVIIYPSDVQGAHASKQIAQTIALANQRKECDVLLLARGGGSLEDLWPFNEAIVAHAIHASQLPIVTGIGHEVDVTIADLVADVRAATPTAAAETVSPDQQTLLAHLHQCEKQCLQAIRYRLNQQQQQLQQLKKSLRHPQQLYQQWAQKIDHIEQQLQAAWQYLFTQRHHQMHQKALQLQQHNPRLGLQKKQQQWHYLYEQLKQQIQVRLQQGQQALQQTSITLDAISPLSTLKRGYAIAMNDQQQIIRDAAQVAPADAIKVRLKQQLLHCTINDITELEG